MYCINATGATATFNFTGTEVHIYGAYRYNSGPYTRVSFRASTRAQITSDSVTIDDVKSDYFRANGSAPAANDDQQLFQVELYGINDLEPGMHEVIVTNEWANAPMRKAGLGGVESTVLPAVVVRSWSTDFRAHLSMKDVVDRAERGQRTGREQRTRGCTTGARSGVGMAINGRRRVAKCGWRRV